MRYFTLAALLLYAHLISAQSSPITLSLFFEKAEFIVANENQWKLEELKDVTDSSYNAVFIKGYADNDGTDDYNLELSEKRVASVAGWFYGKKYDVQTKCYGEKESINKNRNEGEKSLNRRVDVILWTNYAFGENKKKAQVFTFAPNRVIEFTAAEGTKIKIPANALVYANGNQPLGDVEIAIAEFYSMTDIIQNKLTTTSNGEILVSAGMINISASRNENPLRLKEGTTMEVGFAERKDNDGFGVFYGNENSASGTVNWVPAVDPRSVDKSWGYSGVKLFEGDTIERWRSKFEFNNFGQRIRVTEKWVENKGISYDTSIIEKTVNKNKIILQATRLGWINCDMFYEPEQPLVDLIVDADADIEPNVVLIFSDRKAMIAPTSTGQGKIIFQGVPTGEKVVLTGVGAGEGKLYFTKKEFTTAANAVTLNFTESTIANINQQLSGYD